MKSNPLSLDNVIFLPEAEDELCQLDGSIRAQVIKGIRKVSANPGNSSGYGKPLGKSAHNNTNLTGLSKIKFSRIGIRVVYKFVVADGRMLVIVVSTRADDEVYKSAQSRAQKYGLINTE